MFIDIKKAAQLFGLSIAEMNFALLHVDADTAATFYENVGVIYSPADLDVELLESGDDTSRMQLAATTALQGVNVYTGGAVVPVWYAPAANRWGYTLLCAGTIAEHAEWVDMFFSAAINDLQNETTLAGLEYGSVVLDTVAELVLNGQAQSSTTLSSIDAALESLRAADVVKFKDFVTANNVGVFGNINFKQFFELPEPDLFEGLTLLSRIAKNDDFTDIAHVTGSDSFSVGDLLQFSRWDWETLSTIIVVSRRLEDPVKFLDLVVSEPLTAVQNWSSWCKNARVDVQTPTGLAKVALDDIAYLGVDLGKLTGKETSKDVAASLWAATPQGTAFQKASGFGDDEYVNAFTRLPSSWRWLLQRANPSWKETALRASLREAHIK